MSLRSVLFLCVLGLFVTGGLAIQCYICNSLTDMGCKEPLPKYLKDCSDLPEGPKYTMCRKIYQEVPAGAGLDNTPRVIRTCGYEESKAECYQKSGAGGRQLVCTCTEEGCNSATSSHIAFSVASAVILTGLSLQKYLL